MVRFTLIFLSFYFLLCFNQRAEAAAIAVTGVAQGSSGKYDFGGTTDFVMNFTFTANPDNPGDTIEFSQFVVGLSAGNGVPNGTVTLKSSEFPDIVTTLDQGPIANGNSTQDFLLVLSSTATLTSGSYALVFSAPNAAFNDWHIEPATGFNFNEGFNSIGDPGTVSTQAVASNYADGDPDVIGIVPEPVHYTLFAGLSLIGFVALRNKFIDRLNRSYQL